MKYKGIWIDEEKIKQNLERQKAARLATDKLLDEWAAKPGTRKAEYAARHRKLEKRIAALKAVVEKSPGDEEAKRALRRLEHDLGFLIMAGPENAPTGSERKRLLREMAALDRKIEADVAAQDREFEDEMASRNRKNANDKKKP